MPLFFSDTSLGVDLRVLTFQLDDIPVTLHYFVRQSHPTDFSIWFVLREIDHKILRPESTNRSPQKSNRDSFGMEHKVRGEINELCKDEHVWSTQTELRLLKALGLFPLRTPRVVLISPATVVKLLRRFRDDFKALIFESIIIRLIIEASALKSFLLTMKRAIYLYNEANNLSHSNQASFDLLKSATGIFTPYPPVWVSHFGNNAPVMDTFASAILQELLGGNFSSISVPQYSSIRQLPLPTVASTNHSNQNQQGNQCERQDQQFSIQELEQLMSELDFNPNIDQTDSSLNVKYTVSTITLDPSQPIPPITLNQNNEIPNLTCPNPDQPSNQLTPSVSPFIPHQQQLVQHKSHDALVTSLIFPPLNSMFQPKDIKVDLNLKLSSRAPLAQPNSSSLQHIQHDSIPQQLQHLAQCVEISTEVLALSLLPPRFAPSFNVDAAPEAYQRAMPLSLLIKQKQNILKYNAQFDANIKPDGLISLGLADKAAVSTPNPPTSPHYDQLTNPRAHFPLSFHARPKSVYDLNALIYHNLSNFFFMQSYPSGTIEEYEKWVSCSAPEFWVPYPQNPSCRDCQSLYTQYTEQCQVPIDHNVIKTLQQEYQFFLPCLCRMKSSNEKYLSQYLEVGDPELPMPPPPNSHRFKSYLYGDPALLSWPSIVPFSLLISLAFTYYQQQVLFTLMHGGKLDHPNQTLRCPLDQYDLSTFTSLTQSQQQTIIATNSFKWLLQSMIHPIAYSTALVELDPEIVAAFFPNQLPPLVYLVPDRTDFPNSTQLPEDIMSGLPVNPTTSFTRNLVADHVEDTNSIVIDDIFVINNAGSTDEINLNTMPSSNMNDRDKPTPVNTHPSFDIHSITDPYGTKGFDFPFTLSPDNIAFFRSCAYHIDILPPSHRFRLFRHANCLFPISETTQLVLDGHIRTANDLRSENQMANVQLSSEHEDEKKKKKSTRGRKTLEYHLQNGSEPQWARSKLRKLKRERNNHATAEQLAAIWDKQDAITHNNPSLGLSRYNTASLSLDHQPTTQQNFNSPPNHLELVQLGNSTETPTHPIDEFVFNPTSNIHPQTPQLSLAPPLSPNPVYTNPLTTSCTKDVHTITTTTTTTTTYQQRFLNSSLAVSDSEDDLLPQPIGFFSSLYPRSHHLSSSSLEAFPPQNQPYSTLPFDINDSPTTQRPNYPQFTNSPPMSPLPTLSPPPNQFSREFTLSFLQATLPNNLPDCYTSDSKTGSDSY